MKKVKYITKISKVEQIDKDTLQKLQEVEKKYKFRSNDYYNSLINWDDPNDPIKNIIIPKADELYDKYDKLDASNESKYTKTKGLEHKYEDTALILFNDVCGGYCRFCFRKRLFIDGNDDTINDLSEAIEYIKEHQEIKNLLITGGDPFVAGHKKLFKFIEKIIDIPHLQFIRIGTKMMAFNPFIFYDEELIEGLKELSKKKNIKIMNHFNHPNEITKEAKKAANLLKEKANIMLYNQTPIIKGVNDDPKVIKKLLLELDSIKIIPYYFFQMRPTAGNYTYSVPIQKVLDILNEATKDLPGPLKTFKYVMSHESGKIEILGYDEKNTYFRYHRSAKKENENRFFSKKNNPNGHWLEDFS